MQWKFIPLDEVKILKKLAHKTATAYGFPELSEDLAQELLIAKSKGKLVKPNYILINMLRNQFGRSNSPVNYLRKAEYTYTPLSEDELEQLSNENSHNEILSIIEQGHLSERDRAICMLSFFFEFNLKEIGLVYNIDQSYVSMLLKSILKKLKKNI